MQTTPRYQLGFLILANLLGRDLVGEPIIDETHNPESGDALQQTTKGLMVWRKADNWTAFTDGHRSWINGPHGVLVRLNTERFEWELGAPAVHDITSALPVAPWNQHPTRQPNAITMLIVHWDGGPVPLPAAYDPVAYYRTEALYHIQKDWGRGARGYGLMYQEKISRDGHTWLTRPDTDVVWAATNANPFGYMIGVDANEYSPPTIEQRSVLRMRLDALRAKYGLGRQAVHGHGELTQYGNNTACPGPDLLDLVRAYRAG